MTVNAKVRTLVFLLLGLFFTILAILQFSDFLKLTGNPVSDSIFYMLELFFGLGLFTLGIYSYPFGDNSYN